MSQEERTSLLPTNNQEPSSHNRDWKYYLIWIWRFIIFAITGSSSIKVTRYLLNLMHCTNDQWFYYVVFFFAELVVYTVMIVIIGSILFQWRFFCLIAFKMWSWLMPRKVKTWCYEHLHSHRITI